MDRRAFISTACISCLAGSLLVTLAESCSTATRIISGNITGADMMVNLAEFEIKKAGKKEYRKYIVVGNEVLQYPICIYRFGEREFQALLMKCTHQGTELQVFGDKMQCPAHGSEFDSHGNVVNGPASTSLRSFPVTIIDDQLKISLK